jgi:hypothetical protein
VVCDSGAEAEQPTRFGIQYLIEEVPGVPSRNKSPMVFSVADFVDTDTFVVCVWGSVPVPSTISFRASTSLFRMQNLPNSLWDAWFPSGPLASQRAPSFKRNS